MNLLAQTGFSYQAVIRDNSGNVITNQNIGLRFTLIQGSITGTTVYQETQTTLSNDYGVINITVGNGTVVSGTFNTIDWSASTYIKVEVDENGGSSYTDMGTTELLSVPKAMYAEKTKSLEHSFGINVKDYGAVGDDSTDDTQAFNDALVAATAMGRKVFVPVGNYKITSTLVIPDGVTLVGEGVGSSPLSGQYNGSAIRYHGTSGYAIEISGHTSGVRDMVIKDIPTGSADGAIHVKADGELVESIRLNNLLLFDFTAGTALKLESINAGGIAYATFYNVRIRNAKIGVHITEDGPSFTNSNVFHHGAISGGGYDYCLLVDGGNNNQFYGTIMEPYETTYGHIVVNEGEIQCEDIRIEGNGQPADRPLVLMKTNTKNSRIEGTYAGGLTVDKGNNYVAFRSGKAALFRNAEDNLYENSTFYGFDGANLPFWDITGAGVMAEIQSPELLPEHNVLKLTIPSGIIANLEPSVPQIPEIKDLGIYQQVNAGMHVRISTPGVAYIRTNSPNGVTVSQSHPGDGEWHFVSTANLVNTSTILDTRLEINNNTGANLEVYITTPTLNFGMESVKLSAKPITSSGGIITGTLTQGSSDFNNNSNFIVLPLEGNTFFLTGTTDIHRINQSSPNRFPKGTVIHLIFNQSGVSVLDGVYINLSSGFTSNTNSSLSLISMGNGTWIELNRNL